MGNVIILLVALLVLSSCDQDASIGQGGESSRSVSDISSIELVSPTASISLNNQPTFRVEGVQDGDTVNLYTDSECKTLAGTGTAEDTFVDIQTSALSIGVHTFYARVSQSDTESSCSTETATYEVYSNSVIAMSGPETASYLETGILNFSLTFSRTVTVSGTPRLSLTIGSNSVFASYVSGSGSKILQFRYVIAAGLEDKDGISLTSSKIDLNGGDIVLADSTVELDLADVLPNLSGVLIDSVAPNPPTNVTLADSKINLSTTTFNATWTNTNTGVSDFSSYEVAYSTSNTVPPNSGYSSASGTAQHAITDAPAICDQYYVWVRARDSTGNTSAAAVSATSYSFDKVAPTITGGALAVLAYDATTSRAVTADWSKLTLSDNCTGLSDLDLQIAVGTSSGGEEVVSFTSLKTASSIDLSATKTYRIENSVHGFTATLSTATHYYTTVRLVDQLGNTGTNLISQAWHIPEFPETINGISAWFDGLDMNADFNATTVTTGNTVSTWKDKSVTTVDASLSANSGAEPVYLAGGGAKFVSTDLMTGADVFGGSTEEMTVVAVTKENSRSFNRLVSFNGSNTGDNAGADTSDQFFLAASNTLGNWLFNAGDTQDDQVSVNPGVPTGFTAILSATKNTTDNRVFLNINNDESTGTSTGSEKAFTSQLHVGQSAANHDLLELLIYNVELSTSDRQDLEGYLACKYDIRNILDNGHPYYHATGANNTGCP